MALNGHQTKRGNHSDLIEQTRRLLEGHQLTIIENVPAAPIRGDLVLTGPMVGLPMIERRRHFEVSWATLCPPLIRRDPRGEPAYPITTHLSMGNTQWQRLKARGNPSGRRSSVRVEEAKEAMGMVGDLTAREIGEAVPPAMAEYVAGEAMRAAERSVSLQCRHCGEEGGSRDFDHLILLRNQGVCLACVRAQTRQRVSSWRDQQLTDPVKAAGYRAKRTASQRRRRANGRSP